MNFRIPSNSGLCLAPRCHDPAAPTQWTLDRLVKSHETRGDKTLGKADADKIHEPIWFNNFLDMGSGAVTDPELGTRGSVAIARAARLAKAAHWH